MFSLNNWDELLAWFDALEAGMTEEHRDGLKMAYPRHGQRPLSGILNRGLNDRDGILVDPLPPGSRR